MKGILLKLVCLAVISASTQGSSIVSNLQLSNNGSEEGLNEPSSTTWVPITETVTTLLDEPVTEQVSWNNTLSSTNASESTTQAPLNWSNFWPPSWWPFSTNTNLTTPRPSLNSSISGTEPSALSWNSNSTDPSNVTIVSPSISWNSNSSSNGTASTLSSWNFNSSSGNGTETSPLSWNSNSTDRSNDTSPSSNSNSSGNGTAPSLLSWTSNSTETSVLPTLSWSSNSSDIGTGSTPPNWNYNSTGPSYVTSILPTPSWSSNSSGNDTRPSPSNWSYNETIPHNGSHSSSENETVPSLPSWYSNSTKPTNLTHLLPYEPSANLSQNGTGLSNPPSNWHSNSTIGHHSNGNNTFNSSDISGLPAVNAPDQAGPSSKPGEPWSNGLESNGPEEENHSDGRKPKPSGHYNLRPNSDLVKLFRHIKISLDLEIDE